MTDFTAMPASPTCQHPYAVAMQNGVMFCPECREEWDSRMPPPVAHTDPLDPSSPNYGDHRNVGTQRAVGRQASEPLPREDDVIAAVDALGSYDTVVEVTHDDGGSGNVRTDRYVHHSTVPHTLQDALDMAVEHFSVAVGSHVEEAHVAQRIDDGGPDQPLGTDVQTADAGEDPLRYVRFLDVRADRDREVFDDTTKESDDLLAAAYLATLTGTGVTLEGGQRATLLDFPDDDHARVQLATGDVATVDFNDIVSSDVLPDVAPTPEEPIDDETAEMFGGAALILACLVIEAGIASIEGEGADSKLIPPPDGWFPPDEDAIPLMEQAAAGAVSMLIQTFALPRAELQALVAGVRESVTAETTTEVKGNESNTSDE
jgi:hypothetical protein